MCLIIRTETTKPISKELMEHWCQRNGDGWGMMWLQNNTINIHRSMKVAELWDKYQELKEFNPIIHLRWRTHGDTDLANCHPYYCGNGIFLMHNGVISNADNYNKSKSDTWHFIEDWVKGLFSLVKNPHQVMRSKQFKHLFETAIGLNNRIVLGDRGGFVYFNEASWHTIDNEHTGVKGLLVSNSYAWDANKFGKPEEESKWERDFRQRNAHYSGTTHYSKDYTKPVTPLPNHSGHHPSINTQPIKCIDGTYRNRLGEVMIHVVGNIYVDVLNSAWLWSHGLFQRCPEIDKNIQKRIKKEMKKNKGLIPIESPQATLLLPAPEPKAIIVVNDPGTDDEVAEATITYNKEEYTDILVKQWQNESRHAIHSLVYAEPEDAAKVLCSLMGK
jgi:predicted glutamine amidotransferase